MGEKGEGFIETTIKDTWTKTRRGRNWRKVEMAGVVGRGGGGKAENCT